MVKIYRVTVEVDVYWRGSTSPRDWDISDAVKEEIEMGNCQLTANILENSEKLSADVLNSCPYGKDGDEKTIREWLSDD